MNLFLSGIIAICGTIILFIVLMKLLTKYCGKVGYYGLGSLTSPLVSVNHSSSASERSLSHDRHESCFRDDTENDDDIMIKQRVGVVQKTITETKNNKNLDDIEYYDIETGNSKIRSGSI